MIIRTLLIILTATFSFQGFSQFSANLNFTQNPTCAGACNGTASISVTGGVVPYHFAWNNSPLDTCRVFNLCAGTHRVTVTDNGGSMPVTFTFTLTEPKELVATGTFTGVATCYGTEITIAATGGTKPYMGTGTFTSPSGNYVYIVSDANACNDTVPVSISTDPKIKINVTVLDTACPNGLAPVVVTATGGVGPYTGTGTFNVAGGTHYFFVYDSLGCPAVDTVEIPMYPVTNVTITGDTATMCASDSAKLWVTSSFNNYSWNNGATTASIFARQAGFYYLTVMDNNRCKAESNRLQVKTFTMEPVAVSLNGDTLRVYNGTSHQWLYNDSPISGANSMCFVAKQSGKYAVVMQDSNGCYTTSNSIQVTTTDIAEVENSQLNVYPNPSTTGVFNVVMDNSMIGNLMEVYDMNGKIVYSSEVNSIHSAISLDVPAGVYFLRLQAGDHMLLRRLVKVTD